MSMMIQFGNYRTEGYDYVYDYADDEHYDEYDHNKCIIW